MTLFLMVGPNCCGAESLPALARLSITQGIDGIVLSLRGQASERFIVEWTANLGSSSILWTELTRVDGQGSNSPVQITIEPSPAVRFFKTRRVERPLGCDRDGCSVETAGGQCPMLGPPDDKAIRDASIPSAATPVKTLRVLFHRLARGDGSDPVVTEEQVGEQVATLNEVFRPWHLQFIYTQRLVPSDTYRDLDPGFAGVEAKLLRQGHGTNQETHLNVFVTRVEDLGFGGQAVFPWTTNSSGQTLALTRGGGVVVNARRFGPGELVLAHELGHALGLWHTHRGASADEVSLCSACWERAVGSDADHTGDFCSDTPPTPVVNDNLTPAPWDECSLNNWPSTGLANYMSAYPYASGRFTPQQAGRMHAWITHNLSGWLDTNTPAAPSDFQVVPNSFGEIELTWTDNSWNESGFQIQRSLNGVDFDVITNVPRNATSFFHFPPILGASFYRILAANTNAAASSYLTAIGSVVQTVPAASVLFVDAASMAQPPDGTPERPFPMVQQAYEAAPSTAILHIQAGIYSESFLMQNKALRLEPHGGTVRIGSPQ